MNVPEDFAIVDAHHHLWNLQAVHYPWLAAPKGTRRFFGDPTAIQQNYYSASLQKDIGELPVQQSVHIQVGAADGLVEAQWVQEQIDNHDGLPSAMVAFADLASSNINKALDDLQAYRSLRGVRQIVGRSPDEDSQTGSGDLLKNPDWVKGLQHLSDRSLSFDLQLIPSQMQCAFRVFRELDELPVVLCHAGSPWFLNENFQCTERFEVWHRGIEQLASLPHVYCKISGLSMFDQCWDRDKVQQVFQICLENFGVERCMFGSNFPVEKLHVDYQTIWSTYWQLTEELSQDERQLLFADTCRQFYQL